MSNAPKNPGLDGRAREKSGQIDHKHPTTKIKHLREHYGHHFAPDWDGERTLGELLKETKFESLTQIRETPRAPTGEHELTLSQASNTPARRKSRAGLS